MESTTSSSSMDISNQLASNRGAEQGGLLKVWQQERAEEDLLSAQCHTWHGLALPLLPWHGLPVQPPAEGCPADELPCQSTAWWGKVPVPQTEECAGRQKKKSSVPQHCCLPPASCPLLPTPWSRSLGRHHTHPPGPWLPACQGNMILALCRMCWQPQPCPVQQAPHSPVCSGSTTIIGTIQCAGKLLPWGAPTFTQAILGWGGGVSPVL